MSWGYKIVLVFVVFVSGILFMVYRSFNHNIDLVTTNYYEEELQYQDVIDAMERANGLSSKLKCVVNNDTLRVALPAEMKQQPVKATIWLYFIADKKRDIRQEMTTNDGSLQLPLTSLNKGMHDVKIDWQAGGKHYYFEQKLFIQ
ncbi:MAG: hypothetical protein EOO03_05445 [Chitinophagaceae bacterium]|nr:MAG: hypothetical protein EOO03_05445 [Chitinophagaceae bacterium]